MTDGPATLAALVGSRLCHDLISPVGAIQNGLELMALSGGLQAVPEMTLIQDSCANAAARIRFFRIAFGHAGETQMMGRNEVEGNLRDICTGSRMNAEWGPREDVPRGEVQLVYLAYLCCEAALLQGGTVRILRDDQGWSLTGTGPRVQLNAALWAQLGTPTPLGDITPDKVQFAMLAMLAPPRGFKAHVRGDASKLRLDLRRQ